MNAIKLAFVVLSGLVLTACEADISSHLVCTKNGSTVFDSGVVVGFYPIHKLERSDAYQLDGAATYQPEPGSVCRVDYWSGH